MSPTHSITDQSKRETLVITRFPYESSWGGEESHTLDLARHFRKKGFEVIFMGSCPVLLEKFALEGFPVKKVWAGKMIVTPWELLKSYVLSRVYRRNLKKAFLGILKKHDVKALYCLSLNEKLFLSEVALENEVPVTWVEHQEIRNWLLKNFWKKIYQRLSKKVRIVPISKKNEKVLKNELSVPEENMEFITNGISIPDLKNRLSKEKGTLTFANRLIPKKGVMDFLKALEKNKNFFQTKKISIIGEGEQKEEAQVFAKEYLKDYSIQFYNYLKNENWRSVLQRSDVFVSCAQDSNETFSLNTAEALSEGCKVVVTSCSGIADFLIDKKEAFICEPMNPSDLSKKIQEAFGSPNAIREMARSAAKRKFNKESMHEKYYQLILRNHV